MKRQNHNILGLWGWGIMCNFAADMKKTNETIAALLLMALAPNAAFAATNCGVTGNNGMEEITGTKVTEKGITESMVAEKVVNASKASEKVVTASKASEKEAAASKVAEKEAAASKVSLNKTTEKNAFKNNKVIGTKAKDNRITSPGNGLFADSSRVFDIDEVVVAVQPKEQYRLRMQPLSSTSLGARQLTSIHATDLRQLSAFVPSFVMPEYGSRYTSAMYVRGIGSRINNPAVGIYVDGMPVINKAAFNMHFYQADRVDVLRGPQGTIYGQNTEGGLVKIYTKDPFSHQGTDLHLGIGTRLWRNAELAHYAKFSDRAALSLAAFYNGQNGFLRNTFTGKRADNSDEAGARLRFMLRPTSRFSADLIADYQFTRQKGFAYGQFNPADGATEQPSTNYPGSYKRNMLLTALKLGYRAEGFELHSTTSYQLLRDDMLMDQDYTSTDYMHLTQRQLQNALTEELTVKSTTAGIWRWTSGAFLSYQWLKTDAPVFFGPGITQPISTALQRITYNGIVSAMAQRMMAQGMPQEVAMTRAQAAVDAAGGVSMSADMKVPGVFRTPQFNVGVFHESNVHLTDRLTATLGLRYDLNRVDINYDTKAIMALNSTVMGTAATRLVTSALNHGTHKAYNQILPKVGLTLTTDERGSNVYATVSKGYRSGGFNIQMFSDILQTELMANARRAQQGDYDVPHTEADYDRVNKTIAYKPETSWNYELGAHLNLFSGSVHLDLAAYYMQVRNQQLSVMAGTYGFGRMMVNAGKSRSCGIEAALRGSALNNRLEWRASYGMTHATFTDYTDSLKVNGQYEPISYKGKRVPFVPMHTVGAAASYTVPFSKGICQWVRFGLDFSAQGSIYWDEANQYKQKMYALLGAHADVKLGVTTVSLWGRNLTDTRYNTFALSSAATGTTRCFAQRGCPVTGGVDVKIHF